MNDEMYEFQMMRAKAYSKLSLKRPLTKAEFKEYKETCKDIGIFLNEEEET